ncbi:hypothetical protein SDC9_133222 [bioreactor metagenome]|uniref:Uncharacterized protein n=1 Tax=bioreactor metagenome TaxID=1076179 RepID=A0A645DAB6_9ZZZZ
MFSGFPAGHGIQQPYGFGVECCGNTFYYFYVGDTSVFLYHEVGDNSALFVIFKRLNRIFDPVGKKLHKCLIPTWEFGIFLHFCKDFIPFLVLRVNAVAYH